jgi:hypothetical protein
VLASNTGALILASAGRTSIPLSRIATSGTLTGLTDEIATLHTALDALATRVRRHEEQLRRLRTRKG